MHVSSLRTPVFPFMPGVIVPVIVLKAVYGNSGLFLRVDCIGTLVPQCRFKIYIWVPCLTQFFAFVAIKLMEVEKVEMLVVAELTLRRKFFLQSEAYISLYKVT